MWIFDDYQHDGEYRVVEPVIDVVTVDEDASPEQRESLLKQREQDCKKVLVNRIRPYGPDIPKIKVGHRAGPFIFNHDTPIEAGQVLVVAWARYTIPDEHPIDKPNT